MPPPSAYGDSRLSTRRTWCDNNDASQESARRKGEAGQHRGKRGVVRSAGRLVDLVGVGLVLQDDNHAAIGRARIDHHDLVGRDAGYGRAADLVALRQTRLDLALRSRHHLDLDRWDEGSRARDVRGNGRRGTEGDHAHRATRPRLSGVIPRGPAAGKTQVIAKGGVLVTLPSLATDRRRCGGLQWRRLALVVGAGGY